MIENEMTVSVPLEVVKASEIEPKEVKWLWYPYIPFGKVTLLQGDPGDGKSKLMLSVAALLSKGEPLPFTETEENEPVTIIYQTTEDDADDTVVPRFNSAGGNGENLIFIREDEKSLSFGDNRIREAIEMYHAKLLILDPMSSYIGEICSMNNANETRAEFNHLIAVAKDTGCAIVIIAHMNKMKDTNELKEKCRPFLQALEHFPEVAKLFTEKVKQLFSFKEAQERAEKEAREKERQERIKARRNKRGMER